MFWLLGVVLIVLIPVLAGVRVWYRLRHELPVPVLGAVAAAEEALNSPGIIP